MENVTSAHRTPGCCQIACFHGGEADSYKEKTNTRSNLFTVAVMIVCVQELVY